jgi:hypothetical protein
MVRCLVAPVPALWTDDCAIAQTRVLRAPRMAAGLDGPTRKRP